MSISRTNDFLYNIAVDLLVTIVLIIFIFIIQRIVQRLIMKAVEKTDKLSINAGNGLKIIVRLLAAIVILNTIILVFGLPPEISFTLSTFFGALVSFASVQSIQNFIAGFYILFNRPFDIGDLVKIKGYEGVVVQITLNYTKIRTFHGRYHLIPNQSIISASIVNYERKLEKEQQEQPRLRSLRTLSNLAFSDKKEVKRYTFDVALPLANIETTKKKIDTICEDYREIFGYKPTFALLHLDYNLWFTITVLADNVHQIIEYQPSFKEKINAQFY